MLHQSTPRRRGTARIAGLGLLSAAVVAGLVVGGGTYATWSETQSVDRSVVVTGDLEATLGETSRFELDTTVASTPAKPAGQDQSDAGPATDTDGEPESVPEAEPESGQSSPWQEMELEDPARALTPQVWLADVSTATEGPNIQAELTVAATSAGLDQQAAGGFRWHLIPRAAHESGQIEAILDTEPIASGTLAADQGTAAMPIPEGAGEYTLVLTGTLPSHLDGRPVHSSGAAVSVADVKLTLDQVRKG